MTWAPPNPSTINKAPGPRYADFNYAVSGAPLTADTAPNSATPAAARVIVTPPGNGRFKGITCVVACAGGVCTVTGWWYSVTAATWIQAFTQALGTTNVQVAIDAGVVPENVPFFLQVTAITSATFAGALFH